MMKKHHWILGAFWFTLISFFACSGEDKGTEEEKADNKRKELMEDVEVAKSPEEKGKEIVEASFKALSGALKEKMQEGGVEAALEYCSVHALSLTDSLSKVHEARISRVTDKPRNPANELSKADRSVFERFENQWEEDGEVLPHLRIEERRKVYYSAIGIGKELCLNCHGKIGEDIKEEHLELIRERYPEGKATGYEMGDLRGMWRVVFPD